MTVVVLSRTSLNVTQYENVTNIVYANGYYTIFYTSGGSSQSVPYVAATNIVRIIEP